LSALTRALYRQRAVQQLRTTQRLLLDTPEGRVELWRGRVVFPEDRDALDVGDQSTSSVPKPEEIDELLTVARWLTQHAHEVRIVTTRGTFASAFPRLPTYEARRSRAAVAH
jgi:hypothetical protein